MMFMNATWGKGPSSVNFRVGDFIKSFSFSLFLFLFLLLYVTLSTLSISYIYSFSVSGIEKLGLMLARQSSQRLDVTQPQGR